MEVVERKGGLTERDRVKLPRQKIIEMEYNIITSHVLRHSLQHTMEFINAKRKLDEGSQDDKSYNKPHKRHHSDHAPLSSVNHQASQQLGNRNTGVDEIAHTSTKNSTEQLTGNDTPANSAQEASGIKFNSEADSISRPKQTIVPDAPNSSADEIPSLSLQKANTKPATTPKAPLVEKSPKQRQTSGKASGSSADQAPVAKPSKVKTDQKIAQKQEVSSSEPASLDKSKVSSTVPTDVSTNTTSKLALLEPSSPPLEEALGDGEGSQNTEGDDKEEEEEEDDDDGDDLDSGFSSESSIESASDDAFHSDGESHPDAQRKELFKADNPSAFASSMAGILGYKLTRTQRANPILARSATAKEADETLLDMKLEKKAKAEMKRERFKMGGVGLGPDHNLEGIQGKGTQDPLDGQELFANQQQEKELRKMAQKGVIKMFNAFTSVREKTMEAQGLGGSRAKKEEKATEMSKEGWLEYIGQGGKGKV